MAIQELETPFANDFERDQSALLTSADFLTVDDSEVPSRNINAVNFRRDKATMVLDVANPDLFNALIPEEELGYLLESGFRPVAEPHITVINYGSGSNILQRIAQYSGAGKNIILSDISRIAERQDWSWRPFGGLHPFIGRSVSITKMIATIDCPRVANFYKEIEDLIPGVEIERHPMHITILKRPANSVIPIRQELQPKFERPLNGLGHLDLGYESPRAKTDPPKPQGTPWYVKDSVLRRLRVEPTNELVQSDYELDLLKGEEPIFPLSKEIKNKIAHDLAQIDIVAAAAMGRRVSLVPEALEHFIPGIGQPKYSRNISPLERAHFFDRKMEEALESLKAPQITSQRVITGAVVKLATLFNNERLLREAEERQAADLEYYPATVRSLGAYKQLGDITLKELEKLKEEEEFSETLQVKDGHLQLSELNLEHAA